MPSPNFAKYIDEAIAALPKNLKQALKNVAFVIEPFERRRRSGETEIKRGIVTLGLYEGVPQNVWGRNEGGVPPDKITIFQAAIESFAHSEAHLKELVKEVVWHEIGHHFGFDEKQMRTIEERRRKRK